MGGEGAERSGGGGRRAGGGLALADALLATAGAAVGLGVARNVLKPGGFDPALDEHWALLVIFALGGASAAGPPLLLLERRRRRAGTRARWGPGRLCWFNQGMAAWLLWPPILVAENRAEAGICYFYGTPLMALYMAMTLLAGGWTRPRLRGRPGRSAREAFGLLLALLWACTGVYILGKIYSEDFF